MCGNILSVIDEVASQLRIRFGVPLRFSCLLSRHILSPPYGSLWHLDQARYSCYGVASSDFRAELRGKPLQILTITGDVQPHRVLILLDASGSMRGETSVLWPAAVYVADQFAQSNLPAISLGLFIFGDKGRERIPFSQDNARVLRRLDETLADRKYAKEHVYGMTALRDAILEGVRMFGSPERGDAILVISDGGENASRSKESTLRTTLLANRIRFFSYMIRQQSGPIPKEDWGGDLQELATTTGGLLVEPFRGESLGRIAQCLTGHPQPSVLEALLTVDKQIRGYDLVDILLPAPVTKPERWTLRLNKKSLASSRELNSSIRASFFPAALLVLKGPVLLNVLDRRQPRALCLQVQTAARQLCDKPNYAAHSLSAAWK